MIKTILITGAGTGIGRDAAFALAARGHRVIATTLDDAQAHALQLDARTRQQPLEIFKLDITSSEDRDKIRSLELDVLINNAAIGDSGSLAEVDIDRLRKTFEVNVFATLELTQIALRGMLERKSGTILFISSIAGRVPLPFLMPYAMTKFSLSAAGAALRAEIDQLCSNVHIALIEPGAFATGFNQAMNERKYGWMSKHSYFHEHIERMRKRERRQSRSFAFGESENTFSIVRQIIKATEARRPRLRYVAPWHQGFLVRLARICGI